MVDCIHVYGRLITHLDLELSVVAGRKQIGGAELGVQARNHLRFVGRCQRLVVGLGKPRRRGRSGGKIDAALRRADPCRLPPFRRRTGSCSGRFDPIPRRGPAPVNNELLVFEAGCQAVQALKRPRQLLVDAGELHAAEGLAIWKMTVAAERMPGVQVRRVVREADVGAARSGGTTRLGRLQKVALPLGWTSRTQRHWRWRSDASNSPEDRWTRWECSGSRQAEGEGCSSG